ncbi:MAG TPA: fused MFS/spermidine synthase [Mycobacteriales bacterium]|nr:fused MFS/spermidine synthase [Mycobacteriales bacterium]
MDTADTEGAARPAPEAPETLSRGPSGGPPPALGPRAAAALVFLTSGAVLVLEILTLRLIAPYVGLTLETNTAVIGIALAAIATGAWLGGKAADVVPAERLLGPLVLGGGALVFAVLPLVRWTGEAVRGGDASGVLLIAAVAVFVPAALLSAVAPVVVKVRLATLRETGTVVGRLSGTGTLGAIAATFATGFVLVAMVPTSTILYALGGLLLVVGGVLSVRGLGGGRLPVAGRRSVAGPLVLALLGAAAGVAAPDPCALETAYHCARVATDPDRATGRVLLLDALRHSYVDLADPTWLEFAYTRGMASAIDVFRPAGAPVRALHLGGGGLTVPRYLAERRPGTRSLVLEIDAGVLAIDRRTLPDVPGVRTRLGDARVGLADQPAAGQDLVVGDAFGGVAVPWHLATREVLADVRRVLTDDGLYVANVIDHGPLAFARAEVATTAQVFPHVALVATDAALTRRGGNLVIVASPAPLPLDALRRRLAERSAEREPALRMVAGAELVAFTGDARVLTDDFAPVDQLLTPYG